MDASALVRPIDESGRIWIHLERVGRRRLIGCGGGDRIRRAEADRRRLDDAGTLGVSRVGLRRLAAVMGLVVVRGGGGGGGRVGPVQVAERVRVDGAERGEIGRPSRRSVDRELSELQEADSEPNDRGLVEEVCCGCCDDDWTLLVNSSCCAQIAAGTADS